MIGKLKGKVDTIGESFCIVDVGGVGYEVQASARTLRNMKIGEEVGLTIDTHVREDAIRLFGFASEVERSWFRMLQTVQGVGARVALGLLGTLAPRELANAIALSDWASVEQAPGIGKKLAQRIVAEYPPNLIKKAVVGAGHAEKRQIAAMIGFLLPRARFESADEADALAIAICHANHRQARVRIAAGSRQ